MWLFKVIVYDRFHEAKSFSYGLHNDLNADQSAAHSGSESPILSHLNGAQSFPMNALGATQGSVSCKDAAACRLAQGSNSPLNITSSAWLPELQLQKSMIFCCLHQQFSNLPLSDCTELLWTSASGVAPCVVLCCCRPPASRFTCAEHPEILFSELATLCYLPISLKQPGHCPLTSDIFEKCCSLDLFSSSGRSL